MVSRHNKMSGKERESKMAKGELKEFYCIASAGKQVDKYTKTTKAIAEYVGRVYGHEMKILVLQGKETGVPYWKHCYRERQGYLEQTI